jgi:hypothetical protein
MRKMTFLAGAAVGYVLGTRAGQEQYAKIQQFAKKAADSPQMGQAMEMADKAATKVTAMASDKMPFVGGGDKDDDAKGGMPTPRREPAHAGTNSNPSGHASNGTGTGAGAYKPGSTAPGL